MLPHRRKAQGGAGGRISSLPLPSLSPPLTCKILQERRALRRQLALSIEPKNPSQINRHRSVPQGTRRHEAQQKKMSTMVRHVTESGEPRHLHGKVFKKSTFFPQRNCVKGPVRAPQKLKKLVSNCAGKLSDASKAVVSNAKGRLLVQPSPDVRVILGASWDKIEGNDHAISQQQVHSMLEKLQIISTIDRKCCNDDDDDDDDNGNGDCDGDGHAGHHGNIGTGSNTGSITVDATQCIQGKLSGLENQEAGGKDAQLCKFSATVQEKCSLLEGMLKDTATKLEKSRNEANAKIHHHVLLLSCIHSKVSSIGGVMTRLQAGLGC